MDYISRNFKDLSSQERAKIVKGSVIPRPIAWISSLNEDGSTNLAPFSYFSMLNSSTMSVSFRRENDTQKDTARNILRSGEAVVHIADRSLIAALDLSSKPLPPGESEVELTGLTLTGSTTVRTPAISEAKIRLEVTLQQHLELDNFEGDEIESDLLLLRVQAAHIRSDIYDKEKNYINHDLLDPLARLGGPYFAGIDPIEGFEREF